MVSAKASINLTKNPATAAKLVDTTAAEYTKAAAAAKAALATHESNVSNLNLLSNDRRFAKYTKRLEESLAELKTAEAKLTVS